jgi:hypothetical protein
MSNRLRLPLCLKSKSLSTLAYVEVLEAAKRGGVLSPMREGRVWATTYISVKTTNASRRGTNARRRQQTRDAKSLDNIDLVPYYVLYCVAMIILMNTYVPYLGMLGMHDYAASLCCFCILSLLAVASRRTIPLEYESCPVTCHDPPRPQRYS